MTPVFLNVNSSKYGEKYYSTGSGYPDLKISFRDLSVFDYDACYRQPSCDVPSRTTMLEVNVDQNIPGGWAKNTVVVNHDRSRDPATKLFVKLAYSKEMSDLNNSFTLFADEDKPRVGNYFDIEFHGENFSLSQVHYDHGAADNYYRSLGGFKVDGNDAVIGTTNGGKSSTSEIMLANFDPADEWYSDGDTACIIQAHTPNLGKSHLSFYCAQYRSQDQVWLALPFWLLPFDIQASLVETETTDGWFDFLYGYYLGNARVVVRLKKIV